MMVGRRTEIEVEGCQSDGKKKLEYRRKATKPESTLNASMRILRNSRDDGQTMAYHQPTFDGWWCRKYMVMTIRGETPVMVVNYRYRSSR